jgi:signal transduction histidine kinase
MLIPALNVGGDRRAQITVLRGVDAGRRIPLGEPAADIGRGTASLAICLTDPLVSRAHARISRDRAGRLTVEDTRSRYGTFVNGTRVSRAALASGDTIVVGNTALLFDYRDVEADRAIEREQIEIVARLGAALVHDMNNLLFISMLSAADLRATLGRLTGAAEDREDALACITAIDVATERGRDLTSSLLRVARRQPAETKELDLSALVKESIELARRALAQPISIVRAIDDGVRVVGDRGALHRLVINLLLNARDAMGATGQLTVSLDTVQGPLDPSVGASPARGTRAMARLTVRDSGPGMDAATAARIFEPLFTTKAAGTGLGLASVASIACEHGGRVVCISAPNAGTSMVFTLPLVVAHAPASRVTHAPAGQR